MSTASSRVRFFFFSSRRRHTRYWRDWSSDVCSSDLPWQCLYFLPDPHGHGALRLIGASATLPSSRCGIGEIGRASCRGRVKISVVAVSYKKIKVLEGNGGNIVYTR